MTWLTYDRELWALVWAVHHFRHYLRLSPLFPITDHCWVFPLTMTEQVYTAAEPWDWNRYDWAIVHKSNQHTFVYSTVFYCMRG